MERTACTYHPDRRAVCVCVETRQPLCGECTTRYNGVNYSREGLRRLRERRRHEAERVAGRIGLPRLLLVGALSSYVAFRLYAGLGLALLAWLRPA
ncbi:MAG: hypothetical protein LIP77_11375 [Planctomycetes bacterium]|nr:hypothetical protein [Planctomycetota bacterium]